VKRPNRSGLFLLFALAGMAAAALGATRDEALAAKKAGDHPRAIALFGELLAAAPGDTELLLHLGTVQGWAGRYDDALATYERALALAPADVELRLGYARVLAWSGRLERAQTVADAIAAENPRDLDALILQGRIHAWRRNFTTADNIYRSALQADARNVDALVGLGDISRWQEDFDEARDFYTQARQFDPHSAELAAKLKSVRQAGRWRLDAGAERSWFSGQARADWSGWDAALRYAWSKRTGLSGGLEQARRFGFTDWQLTLGADHRFDDRRSGYVRVSATPSADFYADHMLAFGGVWKVRPGDERLPATLLHADYRAATYDPGTAHSLWAGVTQYVNARTALTLRALASRNLNDRWTGGWMARLEREPSDASRWHLGYSDTYESLSSTVFDFTSKVRTRAVFAGLYREFSPSFGLRLDAAHEWTAAGPDRNSLHAGFVTRF